MSLALGALAEIETSLEEKKRLLEKAMEHGTKTEKIMSNGIPSITGTEVIGCSSSLI